MSIRILVLDDGETWAGGGTVMEITDQAYESLCYGNKKVKHLDSVDVVKEWDVNMAPPLRLHRHMFQERRKALRGKR